MTTYTVQAPDGKTITLEGPPGASNDDVIAMAQKLYQPPATPKATYDPVTPVNKDLVRAQVQALAVNPKALAAARTQQAASDQARLTGENVSRAGALRAGTRGPGVAPIALPQAQRYNDMDSASLQGATFGFADELGALGNAIGTGVGNLTGRGPGYSAGDAYKASMAQQAERRAASNAEHPVENAVYSLVGSLVNPLTYVGGDYITGARTAGGGALRAAAVAGGQGALYGAGQGQGVQGRVTGALQQGSAAALTGGVLHAAGSALAAGAGHLPAKVRTPSLDELIGAKNATYKAADSAGVTYSPAALQQMVGGINADLAAVHINSVLHPKAAAMMATMKAEAGKPLTLTQLDQLRQVVRRDVVKGGSEGEQMMGQKIISGIDNFISTATPAQVASGDPAQAAALITRARDLNTRVAKIETITDAQAAAKLRAGSTGSGGNVDNATRQNIRRVLETGRNFSPDEQAALEKVIVGGKIQNVLRLIGKLSPSGNGLTALLELTAGTAGEASGHHGIAAGAMATGLTGLAAKTTADHLTQAGVSELTRQIAGGAGLNTASQRKAALALLRLSAQAAQSPQARSTLVELVAQLNGQSAGQQPAP